MKAERKRRIPKQIIIPPYKKMSPTVNRMIVYLDCDDGKSYTLCDMAESIGISASALHCRIREKGWSHPYVLAEKAHKGQCLDGKIIIKKSHWQKGALAGLSDRPRTANLAKIPPLGSFEMSGRL